MEFNKEEFLKWLRQYTDYDALAAEATDIFTEWSVTDPSLIFSKGHKLADFIDRLTDVIEKFCKDVDNLSSKDKLDAFCDALDDLIKLNKFLEWADNIAIRYMVTAIVQQKNKYLGQDWIKD